MQILNRYSVDETIGDFGSRTRPVAENAYWRPTALR